MALVPYDSESDALARSEAFATALGCGQAPADVTRYWYRAEVDADALPGGVAAALEVLAADDALAVLVRADHLTPEELGALLGLYDAWAPNTTYADGDFVRYVNGLYEIAQPHTSQPGWEPPNVPALWVKRSPPGIVGLWVQPLGAHDAYPLGARVVHPLGGPVWESTAAANVWEPGVFGWVEVPE